jgi:hypothetical protein
LVTSGYTADDAEDAATLIGFGLRPRLRPAKEQGYRDLVTRYRTEPDFRLLVERTGRGLGLRVLGAAADTGLALAAASGSVFETRMEDYVRFSKQRGESEKLLHGIIHLAIAALAFPRPDDLANNEYVGRVSAESVDRAVRDACDRLREKAAESDASGDAPTNTPELDKVWAAYARRPEASRTKDGRLALNSTKGMITRALAFLTDQGLLTLVGAADADGSGAWYRTTQRYQLQVRELAGTAAFEELLSLDVVPLSSTGRLRTVPPQRVEATGEDGEPRLSGGLFDV